MLIILSEIAVFVQPIGVGAILIYIYGYIARHGISKYAEELCLGFVFGLAAIYAMSTPIKLPDGVILDMRNLFVGFAAAFFGWRGGAVALTMAIGMRIGIGGGGMISGIVGVSIAATAGWVWAQIVHAKTRNQILSRSILASMISLHVLAGLLLPSERIARFFYEFAPIMVGLNFFCVWIFTIMVQRERALMAETERLLSEATLDPLTQILNRRSAVKAYRSLDNGPAPVNGIAMTCIDVDEFKTINDNYGHLAGDQVLKDIARRIETCLRPQDIFCRMSGDEFLFVLVNVTSQEARIITERCRSLIARVPTTCGGERIAVSISLGTVWSQIPQTFESFRDCADEALYQAKNQGRNRASFDVRHPAQSAA